MVAVIEPVLKIVIWPLIVLGLALAVIYRPPRWLKDLVGRIRKYEGAGKIGKIDFEPRKGHPEEGMTQPEPRIEVIPREETEVLQEAKAEPEKDLLVELFVASDERDAERIQDLTYKLVEKAGTEDEKLAYRSYGLRLCYDAGVSTALEDLIKLSEDYPNSGAPKFQIGLIFSEAGNHEKALEFLSEAAAIEKNDGQRLSIWFRVCDELVKEKKFREAQSNLQKLLEEYGSPLAKAKIFEKLGDIADMQGKSDMAMGCYEKALELNPGDLSLRFRVAYKYSDKENERLALFHYKKLGERDPMGLNNLGVSYDRLSMPTRATNSYKRAANLGNTLATANLAFGLLSAGFVEEAKSYLEKAQTQNEVHENVYKALAAIPNRVKNEDNAEKEILNEAEIERAQLLNLSEAGMEKEKPSLNIAGNWESNIGELIMTQSGTSAEGIIEAESIRLNGELYGRTLIFKWEETVAFLKKSGEGFLCFKSDARQFEGVLRDFKEKGKIKVISATRI